MTLVSTNVLAVMPLVPAGDNQAAQMKALFQQRQRGAPRTFPGFFRSDQPLDFLRQQTANGGGATGGQDPRFAHGLGAEADRDILFSGVAAGHGCLSARILRATCIVRSARIGSPGKFMFKGCRHPTRISSGPSPSSARPTKS